MIKSLKNKHAEKFIRCEIIDALIKKKMPVNKFLAEYLSGYLTESIGKSPVIRSLFREPFKRRDLGKISVKSPPKKEEKRP